MSGDEPYKVGKNNPPLHTRFQKGAPSANPLGARKKGPIDVAAVFEQPLSIVVDGKTRKVAPLEATQLSLLDKVVKQKNIRAAACLLKLWAESGLIADPNKDGKEPLIYYIPTGWRPEMWKAKFKKLGPPPWPGRRNGLCDPNWREVTLFDDEPS